MILTKVESSPCYLNVTRKALTDIDKLFVNQTIFRHMNAEQKLKTLLSTDDAFYVHIERARTSQSEELYVNMLFDVKENQELMKILPDKTLCLNGVVKDDGLLIIAIKLINKVIGQRNSRRLSFYLHFFINERNPNAFPAGIIESLKALPIAREQSRIVKSRLESWQVYLDLMVERAEKEEALMDYKSARLTDNLRGLMLYCPQLSSEVTNKKLRNAEVKLIWEVEEDTESEKVGVVRRFIYEKNLVEVELDDDYVEFARQNKWSPVFSGKVHISNYGDLAQARRLQAGFKDLEYGAAQNPNLENLLFDEEPLIDTTDHCQTFEFTEAIQDNLNEYQREAVKGALAAEDLYLIQGPPGTGKTTVIAEICYQNVERGLKTLIASQSNLAVDNALSKLLSHPKVRILRKGRTKSIEEEGKKYIEENVAHTWKEQTRQSVYEHRKELEAKLKTIQIEYDQAKEKILLNEKKKNYIEQSPIIKKDLEQLKTELAVKNQELNEFRKKNKKFEKRIMTLDETIERDVSEMEEKCRILENWAEMNVWEIKKKRLHEEITTLEIQIDYLKKEASLNERHQQMQQLKKSITHYQTHQGVVEAFVCQQANQMDFNELHSFISGRPDLNDSHLLAMQKKLSYYQTMMNQSEVNKKQIENKMKLFEPLEEQVNKLLNKQEHILEKYNYDTELARSLAKPSLVSEKVSLRGLTKAVMNFTEPNVFQFLFFKLTNKRPNAIEQLSQQFIESISLKQGLEKERENLCQRQVELEKVDREFPALLNEFKSKLFHFYEKRLIQIRETVAQQTYQLTDVRQEIYQLNQTLGNMKSEIGEITHSLAEVSSLQNDKKCALYNLGTEDEYKARLVAFLKQKKQALKENHASLQKTKSNQEIHRNNKRELEKWVASLEEKKKEKEVITNYLATIKMEQELVLIVRMNQELTNHLDYLTQEKLKIQQLLKIKEDWTEMLEEANDYDLREVKKLYIKHANVIGITCVQSARKDFVEDYPDFDVVIIDEVSKATPPELLLPMLKGKKIILVGDHHQLPPLIGQETLDEVIDQISDEHKKEEVRTNLKESLFERIFKSLPEQYKTTLRIQYRMHEDIMDTITQFYEDRNDSTGYGLSCGLTNSNAQRDHQLEGQLIKRGQHIMWFDLPNEKSFFEQQEVGTTSRYNQCELKIISAVLTDLNEATRIAKIEGRMKASDKKQVGIVSFYGEQVRKLKRLVDDELDLPHLSYRIGTVDRFQGMESDVIIASFVRNHDNQNDDIGFSNDYRRLNVALSRAKELLIITGSAKMFTQKAKRVSSRKMYQRVTDSIRLKNGMRDHLGRVK